MSTTSTSLGTSLETSLAAPRRGLAGAARPQLTVMSGQLVAGAGNLLYAVVLARVLDPADYAQVVAFLAVYVLMHVPAAAFSAAGALAPGAADRLTPRLGAIGIAAGVLIAATSGWIARATGLDRTLVLGLAAAAPAAALLGLRRGIAYGHEQLGRITVSLVAEPATRLGVGVALALIAGPVGAAAGAVIAGYAALTVCATGRSPAVRPGQTVTSRMAATVGGSFVLMAVLQALDLLIANRVLDDDAAARFAVLSTIGGAAFFATATIPLVLMPAAARGRDRAVPAALGLTVGVGIAVAVLGAVLARPLLGVAFGENYRDVAHLVGPYLLAMALLGVVRVEVARFAAERDAAAVSRSAIGIAAALVMELFGLAAWGTHVGAFVAVTLLTATSLVVVVELPTVLVRRRETSPTLPSIPGALRRHSTWAMAGLCAVAAAVRMATSRGLWVDEAISVSQAKMPFGQMLADVRSTDVHPPLHHALLWVTVRVLGTSEAAVRMPSLLAGVALVPVMAWVGRVVYDRRTGWIAAALSAVAPFAVWYSQEARMYSIFMLFAALAVGAQVQALRTGRSRDWALFGVATAALIWTQYFALLPVAVQLIAIGWVAVRDRHDRERIRALVRGGLVAAAIAAVLLAPMVPILLDQLAAYGSRGAGLTPGQAGVGNSELGGTISVYAVGANLIWATLGYHADGVMVQLAALWPLLMLLALVMLGRGRSGRSMLLLALVVVPMAALFLVGSLKRDLFELRYFAGAVPAMVLLGARVITATVVRRGSLLVCSAIVTAALAVGLVDQQLNGANPRLYDFEGAFAEIGERAEPGDVVLYEPSYLAEVVAYYAPGVEARPVGSHLGDGVGTVFVLATERVLDAEDTSARLGAELAVLDGDRDIVDIFERPNVTVWEMR